MENEKYEAWNAHEILPVNFYLASLHHEGGSLKVSFKEVALSEQKQFEIAFSNYLAYRVVIETGRLKSLDNGSLSPFSKTSESQFISWFKDEALGVYDDRVLIHYAIVNLDNIVDVISEFPPVVEWVSLPRLAKFAVYSR
jgi:hypothetical protein